LLLLAVLAEVHTMKAVVEVLVATALLLVHQEAEPLLKVKLDY
jgi:hypothetical protein